MTLLDDLQRARRVLETVHTMGEVELRQALAAGFDEERPPNDAPLAPEQWADAMLTYISQGAQMTSERLGLPHGEWVSGLTARGGVGDEGTPPPSN